MEREKAILIFKALSDASRLNIISTLQNGEAYGELLAERLGLSASTLSFHMKKLEEAGLVRSRKEQYYTVFSLEPDLTKLRLADMLADCPSSEEDEAKKREDAYRQKVLDAFFDGAVLRSIPVQRRKKQIVLQKISECFAPGKVYDEKELSEIIARIHPDYCTIRRDMVSEGILKRENGKYVRVK
ncbi:MAG: metalloregulator ArsR/SmtB family transcription factor [Clostridia bacterium]|nr:metalloregulator ArsR/SmtB family transcription factor [Clostridia bacterium]